jgi:hypothetical protein
MLIRRMSRRVNPKTVTATRSASRSPKPSMIILVGNGRNTTKSRSSRFNRKNTASTFVNSAVMAE